MSSSEQDEFAYRARAQAPVTSRISDDAMAVNTFKVMNALLDEHSKLLGKLIAVDAARIPEGKTYPFTIPLRFTTNRVVFIDFLDDSDTKNVPSDAFANSPYVKLRKLRIANDGPASVNFSTNGTPTDSSGRGGTLTSSSVVEVDFYGFAVIETLTLALATDATQDATVRILGFV